MIYYYRGYAIKFYNGMYYILSMPVPPPLTLKKAKEMIDQQILLNHEQRTK